VNLQIFNTEMHLYKLHNLFIWLQKNVMNDRGPIRLGSDNWLTLNINKVIPEQQLSILINK